jgi:hypothetical protein
MPRGRPKGPPKLRIVRLMAGSYEVPTLNAKLFAIPRYWVVQIHGKDIHFRKKADAVHFLHKEFAAAKQAGKLHLAT